MSRSTPLLPQRTFLTTQVAAAVRRGIEEGTWKEVLPGERRLCEMYQVSRPTVRAALRLLQKEKLLEIRHGRRNRICAAGKTRPATSETRLVVLITTEPIGRLSYTAFQYISEMRSHLLEAGFPSEVLVCESRSGQAQQRKIETFFQHNRVFCCVLLSVSKEVQQWFAARSMPALVLGSCHPKVSLPSLDSDNRAVCRHAAGVLLAKGHRRLALVVPDSGVAGDIASEEGFREGVASSGHADALALIVRHNGTARNLTTRLESLFRSSQAPTALLVAKPLHVLMTVIYLLKRGLAVPDAVSLIARDKDYTFDAVNPPIDHYEFPEGAFAQRLTRLMLMLVNQGHLPPEPNFIFPHYAKGGTVKSLQLLRTTAMHSIS